MLLAPPSTAETAPAQTQPAAQASPATAPAPPMLPPPPSQSTAAPTSTPAAATSAPGMTPRDPHREIKPADASARPGEHTREWRPPTDLVHVPFPLERSRNVASDQRYRAPIVDLRDPFVHGRPGRPLPAEVRRQLLPDLKDPFVLPRHPRPRGWKITLPGDIRDPFEVRTTNWRADCGGAPESTRDGVTIQRPKGSGSAPGSQPKEPAKAASNCRRITRPLPADLLDPFRRR